ncbi:protein kinase [Streptomyces sp. KL116D]|uniref:serine/threonine-protein kinase n=1 Tax=Streptomyces sp. KL116D TaxID=3045152 RepID=UPI0035562644
MGEVFAGRYELADPIGRGGVGAVWRAWDHRRHRYVAAKVLQQSDAHTLLRFVREQALRIDHPHVLAPASWAADDDKVLFTMELVAGGSLAHLIGDYGPLPPQFVCVLLDQLLSGLTAVHAEGVVHRDIKPANILLEATGTGLPHLRLSDFGIAMRKGEPRLTETNYVVGTPGYFAPEQALGAEPDFPADLFAAGLVALYLLEGAKPDSKALIEHFADHGTPGAPQGVPGPLWGVLAGLLQPDPDARFRTATGARKALLAATELLPEPGPDDELIEVFDQLGPLPPGFGPNGPATRGRRARPVHTTATRPTPPGEHPTPYATPPTAPRMVPAPPAEPPSLPHPEPTPQPESTPLPPREPLQDQVQEQLPNPAREPAREPVREPAQEPVEEPVREPAQEPARQEPVQGSIQEPGPPAPLPSMSETGSFHLPPPLTPDDQLPPPPPPVPPMPAVLPLAPMPEPTSGHQPPTPEPQPGPTPDASDPTPEPHPFAVAPRTSPLPPEATHVPHASHASHVTHVTHAPHALSPQPAHATTALVPHERSRHSLYTARSREVPKRRPGPPPKVTIPVLLLALLCFAVGIWALTQA